VKSGSELDRLGQEIEKCHADDGAGAETQYEMQFVAQTEGQQPAAQGARERRDGDD
jgi:hypothetical protein